MNLRNFEDLNKRKKLIEVGDKIVIAMSGGPDSIYLYELLKYVKEKMDLTLYFAHINHSLRGEDSDDDEKFVIDLGQREKIETFTRKVEIKKYAKDNKLSEEEAGREIRYGFFKEIKEKVGATKVALAHNEDDVVETFLFRLIRGTSLKGLEGIPVKREYIIRPIMSYRKEQILDYLDDENIQYRTDKTNFQSIYTRNKIRLDLIPSIEREYNVNFKEKIINLISDIGEFNGIINSNVQKYLINDTLSIKELKKETNFIQRAIISEYLQKYDISVSRNKILEVQKLIDSTGSKEIQGNSKYIIKKVYDSISIVEVKSKNILEDDQVSLKIPGSVIWRNYQITAEIVQNENLKIESKEVFYCSLSKMDNLVIRSRNNGDKLYPVGMKGSKKVKELFIDLKIPKEDRSNYPIITHESDIVWVGGIRKDRRFMSTDSKSMKLKIEKL